MKKLIIIILILIVLGLYFYTAETKEFLQGTGNYAKNTVSNWAEDIKEDTEDNNKETKTSTET